jgi:hypothetical protein
MRHKIRTVRSNIRLINQTSCYRLSIKRSFTNESKRLKKNDPSGLSNSISVLCSLWYEEDCLTLITQKHIRFITLTVIEEKGRPYIKKV